jgi:hypothetical protein
VVGLVLIACGESEPTVPSEAGSTPTGLTIAERHENARLGAWSWLDELEIDPVALVERGHKGKKKLGEALTAYLYLLRYAKDPDERQRIADRVDELVRHTDRTAYHDMLENDLSAFNENSMSYFRVAWLLDQLGRDTAAYRGHLEAIRPRLEATLAKRTPAARAQFASYYTYLGWETPALLQAASQASLVDQRLPLVRYRRGSGYALAHEVASAHRFRVDGALAAFDAEDRAYLRNVLPKLSIRFSSGKQANVDLIAELSSAMAALDLRRLPAYRTGIQFLVRRQNADGSWGAYEPGRARLGDDVEINLYLHTTMVALRALLQSGELTPHH